MIGSARFTIIASNDEYGNELNNWSVATLVDSAFKIKYNVLKALSTIL